MPNATMPWMSSASNAPLAPAQGPPSASVRSRNRRLVGAQDDTGASSALSSPSRSPSRSATPIPAAHIGSVTGRNNSGAEVVRGGAGAKNPTTTGRRFLQGSWSPSWASVQELASSLLAGEGAAHRPRTRDASRSGRPSRQGSYRDDRGDNSWGPAPPNERRRPRPDDVAAGSLSQREAALKAMRTVSVLESHEGVNGGLDVARKFKKRNSDEDLRGPGQNQEPEEYFAYIHHVQKTDTYAGVVLKYSCREDAFRKANGLWSRDNIQVRKWLAIPVDACEVKGRPCDPPANHSSTIDRLSRIPDATDPFGADTRGTKDGFFANRPNGRTAEQTQSGDHDVPWTRVRWVTIDSCPYPVEVARVPRKALGYFPPRRKKSMQSTSTLSTPRASLDLPNLNLSSPAAESPRSSPSRRPSLLSTRGASTTSTTRSRLNSTTTTAAHSDPRPAWMRRPGGVGSLGRHVHAPGPEGDYLNAWTNKHLPGLNIDSLPSMSVMGSESARFGFARPDEDAPSAAIVESPFEGGRDTAAATSRQASGLDKAAAAIETWLRGAFERARQGPLTPALGPRARSGGGAPEVAGDFIELADTNSDDGRPQHGSLTWDTGGLLGSLSASAASRNVPSGSGSSSGRSQGQRAAAARGRGAAALGGSKKAD